jgi:uncharacterized protein
MKAVVGRTRTSSFITKQVERPANEIRGRIGSTLDRWLVAPSALLAVYIVANEIAADGSPIERTTVSVAVMVGAVALNVVAARSTRAVHGLLALVVALLGITTVVGMRAYVVAKAGLEPIDLIAIPTLVSSLALLVVASVRLLRPVRRWRRLLAIPVGLLVLYYVVAPVAVGLMLTHVPPIALGSGSPADLGLVYRDVSFRTPDHVRLSGWYLPSSNGAAIAMLHGAGSTRSAVLDHAAFLNRAGYGTLLFDSRGFGKSDGVGLSSGWWGDLDIRGAIDFLARQPDVDASRIGVFGLSMGGEEAIAAAAGDARIRAIVAEGAGAIRTVEDTQSIPGWNRYLGIPHYWVQTQTIDLFTDAPRPIALEDAMRKIAPRPVLLISAGSIETAYTEQYRSAAPSTTELWNVSDAGHTAALYVHPGEYRSRVLGLFDTLTGPAT